MCKWIRDRIKNWIGFSWFEEGIRKWGEKLETFRDIHSRTFPFSRFRCTKHSHRGLEWLFLMFLQILRLISLSNIANFSNTEEKRYRNIDLYVIGWLGATIGLFLIYLFLYWYWHYIIVIVFVLMLLIEFRLLRLFLRHLRLSWVYVLLLFSSLLIIAVIILLHCPYYLYILIFVYRLSDIFSAQLGIIFIDKLKGGKILSLGRSLLLIGINYLEIIVGFAIMYLATESIRYSNCGNIVTNPFDTLYFSIATITTLGCGSMEPIPFSGGRVFVGLELFCGLTIIVLVIGAFFTFYANKK